MAYESFCMISFGCCHGLAEINIWVHRTASLQLFLCCIRNQDATGCSCVRGPLEISLNKLASVTCRWLGDVIGRSLAVKVVNVGWLGSYTQTNKTYICVLLDGIRPPCILRQLRTYTGHWRTQVKRVVRLGLNFMYVEYVPLSKRVRSVWSKEMAVVILHLLKVTSPFCNCCFRVGFLKVPNTSMERQNLITVA